MRHLDILCWTHTGFEGRTHGHAAILIDGSVETAAADNDPAQKTYISWWPAGAAYKGPTTPFSRRPGGERTLLDDMRNEMSDATKRALVTGRYAPRRGQGNVFTASLDLGAGPLAAYDRVDDDEHVAFMQALDADGLHNILVQCPTEIISLHTEGNGELGLNAKAMITWWRAFRIAHQYQLHGQSGYQFVSTLYNCASIVMRALIVGEAGFFLKPPAAWFAFSPRDVADYATALKGAIIRANMEYNRYFNAKLQWQAINRREMHMHPPTAEVELPTVDQWRAMSDANVKFVALARRREQTAEIDRLLGGYHAQQAWDERTGAGYLDRLEYLSLIFEQVSSYIAAKPNGDRLNAMLALAQIVLAVRDAKARNAVLTCFN